MLLGRILWLDFFDLSNYYFSVVENILLSWALFLLLHLYTKPLHRPFGNVTAKSSLSLT